MRLSISQEDAVQAAAGMTAPMKQLAAIGRNHMPAPEATLAALEERGLIARRGDQWNWTALGRAALRHIDHEGE
jgi:superfamily II helicase